MLISLEGEWDLVLVVHQSQISGKFRFLHLKMTEKISLLQSEYTWSLSWTYLDDKVAEKIRSG